MADQNRGDREELRTLIEEYEQLIADESLNAVTVGKAPATDDRDRLIHWEVDPERFIFKDQNLGGVIDQTSVMSEIADAISKMLPAGSKEWRQQCASEFRRLFKQKSGRRKGTKADAHIKYSKAELYEKLDNLIKYFELQGNALTQAQAAKTLGLGYEKNLQRMRRHYDDKRHWKTLVNEVLTARQ